MSSPHLKLASSLFHSWINALHVVLGIVHTGSVEPGRRDAAGVAVCPSHRTVLCNLLAEADQQVFLCVEHFFP